MLLVHKKLGAIVLSKEGAFVEPVFSLDHVFIAEVVWGVYAFFFSQEDEHIKGIVMIDSSLLFIIAYYLTISTVSI